MDAKTKTQSIVKTISLVMADLAKKGIGKNQKTESGSIYSYRGIDDLLNTLPTVLPLHELIIIPELVEKNIRIGQTAKGAFQEQVHLTMKYTLCHGYNEETKVTVVPGEAFDTSDKAISKAMSICYKAMAVQLFIIPIVGNDDQDAHQPEVGQAKTVLLKESIQALYDKGCDAEIKNWMDAHPEWMDNQDEVYLMKLEKRLKSGAQPKENK